MGECYTCACVVTAIGALQIGNELLGNAMSHEMTFKLLDDVDRGYTSQMVELKEIAKIVHSHKVTFSVKLFFYFSIKGRVL